MYACVRKGFVLGVVLIFCLYIVNFFSSKSEPSDLELSGVWGGETFTCWACEQYGYDCGTPTDGCTYDSEFEMCFGQKVEGSCYVSTGGSCVETGNPYHECTPHLVHCPTDYIKVSGCTEDPPQSGQCKSDGAQESYYCDDEEFHSCYGNIL